MASHTKDSELSLESTELPNLVQIAPPARPEHACALRALREGGDYILNSDLQNHRSNDHNLSI